MTAHDPIDPADAEIVDSWATSVNDDLARSRMRAWVVAGTASLIALLEAIALVLLMPLKTVEPYTLLVDRQTGHVEALAPLESDVVAPDAALTRSFLVQYVIARESYDYENLQSDYRKVALWTEGEERQRYLSIMQSNNPASPIAAYPRSTRLLVEVKSVTSVAGSSSLVRFQTTRLDRGSQPQDRQHWVSLINYSFSSAEMSEEDRLMNPLGFQVTRYRRDAEMLPEELPQEFPTVPGQRAPVGGANQ